MRAGGGGILRSNDGDWVAGFVRKLGNMSSTVAELCSKLEELDLSQNYFIGTIPFGIYRLSHLRHLNLGANSFCGNIPSSIGQLTELRTLQLLQCAFNGSFPREIGNLFNLESLQLTHNVNMTATELPPSFTQLKKLELQTIGLKVSCQNTSVIRRLLGVVAFNNNLTGELPKSLGNCNGLKIVTVYNNRLSGNILSGLWTSLNLSNNSFTGELPQSVARNLSRLEISHLSTLTAANILNL
nr:leucine-rich repeat receptor-like protein kinase pxl1 [Quercus suber]